MDQTLYLQDSLYEFLKLFKRPTSSDIHMMDG